MAFSVTPVRILPPTDDQATVRELLGSLKANGGTAMGDALLNAVEISRPAQEKTLRAKGPRVC